MHIYISLSLAFFALFFLSSGCGQNHPPSEFKVTNGSETADQDPAVVLLRFGQGNICTGTYISDHIILTAAHCTQSPTIEVVNPHRNGGSLELQVVRRSEAVRSNPGYRRPEDIRHDLGLVKMPRGSSSHWLPISARGGRVGDQVRMVGFGHNYINQDTDGYVMTEKGAGNKRSGTNQIAIASDGALRFNGFISPRQAADNGQPVGVSVGIGGGDSGGPLVNRSGELVGIASAQNPTWGEWESIRAMESVFVDLSTADAQAFLRQADRI